MISQLLLSICRDLSHEQIIIWETREGSHVLIDDILALVVSHELYHMELYHMGDTQRLSCHD